MASPNEISICQRGMNPDIVTSTFVETHKSPHENCSGPEVGLRALRTAESRQSKFSFGLCGAKSFR